MSTVKSYICDSCKKRAHSETSSFMTNIKIEGCTKHQPSRTIRIDFQLAQSPEDIHICKSCMVKAIAGIELEVDV